jgi:hypothetical protein
MPNINLLQTITTATDNNAYFVVSNNGLARRFKYENLVTQLQGNIPDLNRTDQNLFTSSNVTFQSVNVSDFAATSLSGEVRHGFQSTSYHEDGTATKQRDYLGTIRFGGFDGIANTIIDKSLSTMGITTYATEDWEADGTFTSRSGTGFGMYYQPNNTYLSTSSRITLLTAYSTSTPTTQAISLIRLGNVPTESHAVTTASNGVNTFTGPGRAEIGIVNSRITQVGMPYEDSSPVNSTLLGTNYYTFLTGRSHTYSGNKTPLHHNDTLGAIQFRGVTTSTNDTGVLVALIRAHTTCDYSDSNYGSGIHIRTVSSGTNAELVTSLELQPEGNTHSSDFHKFTDRAGDGGIVTITNGTVVFDDNSVQSTAYQGFTSVPGSSSATGTTGQMAYDSNYFYICVATNTWKRIVASDF